MGISGQPRPTAVDDYTLSSANICSSFLFKKNIIIVFDQNMQKLHFFNLVLDLVLILHS